MGAFAFGRDVYEYPPLRWWWHYLCALFYWLSPFLANDYWHDLHITGWMGWTGDGRRKGEEDHTGRHMDENTNTQEGSMGEIATMRPLLYAMYINLSPTLYPHTHSHTHTIPLVSEPLFLMDTAVRAILYQAESYRIFRDWILTWSDLLLM
ncbi:hypothetical protein F4804DRAFT_171666 [Jackrogersella minutella]|nr:hypothetical protein F4804DRAFT_171666 [Jackrogersella minutella]